MRALLRFSALVDRIHRRIGALVAWLVLLMVLVGAFNALARYFGRGAGIQLSSNAYIELQWYLFSLVFLLGAPYVLCANGHVRVDVIYGRLTPRSRAWIDLAGGILFLLPFCVAAVWIGWPSVHESWKVHERSPDPGGLVRYPIKTAVLASFALLGLQGFSEIVKRAAFLRGLSPKEIGPDEPGEEDIRGRREPGEEDIRGRREPGEEEVRGRREPGEEDLLGRPEPGEPRERSAGEGHF